MLIMLLYQASECTKRLKLLTPQISPSTVRSFLEAGRGLAFSISDVPKDTHEPSVQQALSKTALQLHTLLEGTLAADCNGSLCL